MITPKYMRRFLSIVFLLFISNVFSQSIKIQFGKNNIALNEYFSISLVATDQNMQSYSGFPNITNFNKLGTSSNSSMSFVNGSRSSSFTLTQNYQATKEGVFKLQAFTITVDGKTYNSPGTTITVGPAKQQQQRRRNMWDPFGSSEPQEFVDVEDNAFFAISSNKNSIFEGEGVTITGTIYIPIAQRNLFSWPNNLGEQIHEIKKRITPTNCWEEAFEIKEIQAEQVKLEGMNFMKCKVFQSVFYPINDEDIKLSSQSIEMIKYKVAKQRSFFGSNAQETAKKFHSKPKTIQVKPLPNHPLKNKVSVGDYKMVEKVDKVKLTTNEGVKLNIKIYGEGNISAINTPTINSNDSLNFFKPNILTNINRDEGRVVGSKEFLYDIIPNEPGFYKLDDKIQFIYFNYRTEKYDTLSPSIPLMITGESHKNNSISDSDLGAFYDTIDIENSTLRKRATEGWLKLFVNLFILVILVVSGYLITKKQNG